MSRIDLLASTGNPKVDDALRGLILLFQSVFPGRMKSGYVTGSYADGSAVSTSDLDAKFVLSGEVLPEEDAKFAQIRDACCLLCDVDLDVSLTGEAPLLQHGNLGLKLAGLHVYGEDLRERIPLPEWNSYLRGAMAQPISFFWRVRGFLSPLTVPLDYPDPEGEFYGYDQRPINTSDGGQQNGIKEIVVSSGWAARAILALKAWQYVAKKIDCLRLYQEHIHDEWTPWLEDIYHKCREEWQYLVPEAPKDRRKLREICARAPAFENHYLALFRDFLLSELQSGEEEAVKLAVRQLGRVVYPDPEVRSAVEALSGRVDEETEQEVVAVLKAYRSIVDKLAFNFSGDGAMRGGGK